MRSNKPPEALTATIPCEGTCSTAKRPVATLHRFAHARTMPTYDKHVFACTVCRTQRFYGTARHADIEPEAA